MKNAPNMARRQPRNGGRRRRRGTMWVPLPVEQWLAPLVVPLIYSSSVCYRAGVTIAQLF